MQEQVRPLQCPFFVKKVAYLRRWLHCIVIVLRRRLSDMKPRYQTLNDSFLDGPLGHCLRYLPPQERPELSYFAHCDHADEPGGDERTFKISVRVPISLLIRLDIERATTKRALRRRRATRSDTVRHLIEEQLAQLDRERAAAANVEERQEEQAKLRAAA